MTVLCGIDGSAISAAVQEVGEAMAWRLGLPCEALNVEEPAHEGLLEAARARDAALLVVGHAGRRAGLLRLGSTAEQVCQAAELPVLVVRDPAPLLAWARGERALRVAVLVDETPAAAGPVAWTARLAAAGPLEIDLIHLVWPPAEQARLGLDEPMSLEQVHPEVRASREAELRRLATEAGLNAEPVVCLGWGRPADHLVAAARERGADLIVIGTRRRGLLDRLWSGSVTYGVVGEATCSVAAVPGRAAT